MSCVMLSVLLPVWAMVSGAGNPAPGPAYALPVLPREDSARKDPDTGAELLFLTKGQYKDANLYFHQRSWLADSSLILFTSSRDKGGLMGYVVETGELVKITAGDGAKLGYPTAAKNRNSVFAVAGNRVLEIQLAIAITDQAGSKHAAVHARERQLCAIRGINVYLNESCDGRYLAAGGDHIENAAKPGLVIIDEQSDHWERLCDMPNGVEYHGHVQWSMTNPNWLSFAGAPNRLWVVDIRDRKPWCPYHESPGELVTHESWWVNDQLIFCGGVHPKPTEDSNVKVLDMRSGTIRIVGEGAWWPEATPKEIANRNWWHASASQDGRWVAADNWHGDIMLFDAKTARPHLLTTNHRTYGSGEHPHVGWDRRGEQVIFAANETSGVTVCVATIPKAWQEDLNKIQIGLEAK